MESEDKFGDNSLRCQSGGGGSCQGYINTGQILDLLADISVMIRKKSVSIGGGFVSPMDCLLYHLGC